MQNYSANRSIPPHHNHIIMPYNECKVKLNRAGVKSKVNKCKECELRG